MRISTNEFNTLGLNSMLDVQAQLAATEQQIDTGNKVNQAADNPISASLILKYNQSLSQTNSYANNADFAQSQLSLENTLLDSAHNILMDARFLITQANSAQNDTDDLNAYSLQLQGILEQMLDVANSKDSSGQYFFAGFFGGTVPFSYDTNGSISYNGSSGQRYLQIGSEAEVAINDSGLDVFNDIKSGNGTFTTNVNVNNTGTGVINIGTVVTPGTQLALDYTIIFSNDPVTNDLQYTVMDSLGNTTVAATNFVSDSAIDFAGVSIKIAGTPAVGDSFTIAPSENESIFTTIQYCIDALGQPNATVRANMLNHGLQNLINDDDSINTVLASVGARLNTVQNEMAQNSGLMLNLSTNISDIQTLDLRAAISNLTQQSVALQAAYAVYSKISNISLFNYLE